MKSAKLKFWAAAVLIVALGYVAWHLMHGLTAQDIVAWYRDNLDYGTVALLMAVESSFIPFPSEIVVPPAAYFAHQSGELNIALIVVVATLGALVGAAINYVLALLVGRPLVYAFAESRLGSICLITKEKVIKAEQFFDRHGALSTFLGRLVPAVRQLISIPAGLARMNFAKFLAFTALGAGLWNTLLALLGYWLSLFVPEQELFMQIEHYNRYLTWAGIALVALVVAFVVYQAIKKKNK